MVTRESWLAGSSWSLRSMFGTAASLAGIQNRVNASIRNCATNSQMRLSTIGIEANSPNRRTSTTTIVLRRSNRSANAPASGPSTIAGSSRNSRTPPRAKLAAANPLTSEVAVAVIASRPSQSPKLDSDIDSHSRRKSRTRRTARSLATSPTAPIPLSTGASGGTGTPADGSPSTGGVVRSAGCASTASSRGGVGSDGIRTPGVGGGRTLSLGGLTVPAGADVPGTFPPGREPGYRRLGFSPMAADEQSTDVSGLLGPGHLPPLRRRTGPPLRRPGRPARRRRPRSRWSISAAARAP